MWVWGEMASSHLGEGGVFFVVPPKMAVFLSCEFVVSCHSHLPNLCCPGNRIPANTDPVHMWLNSLSRAETYSIVLLNLNLHLVTLFIL